MLLLLGVADNVTSAVTSPMTSTVTSDDEDNLAVIIGVSVVAAVLLVIAAVLLIVLICRVYQRRTADLYVTQAANFAWETDDIVTCTHRTGRSVSLCISITSDTTQRLFRNLPTQNIHCEREKRNRAFFVIIWVNVFSSNFRQICRNTL